MNTLKVIVMIIQHSFVYEIMQLVLHGVLYLFIGFQLSKNLTFFFLLHFFTFYLKKKKCVCKCNREKTQTFTDIFFFWISIEESISGLWFIIWTQKVNNDLKVVYLFLKFRSYSVLHDFVSNRLEIKNILRSIKNNLFWDCNIKEKINYIWFSFRM